MTEGERFRELTVLSIEQATVLPFLTQRLAMEGMRVIRVETPGKGDPNRYVGSPALGEEGMGTYFLPNNLGKEGITLDLATEKGQSLLAGLVRKLPVDVFATNLRPRSYRKLGVGYETLSAIRPGLVWLGITGFGPDSDEAAYDPILQARAGWMELTGEPGGPPLVFGLPMADLGTAEHAYGLVMKALYRRAATGEGSRIDLSMLASAASWLANPILLSESFGETITRRGNTHPFFSPCSVYPTRDGHVYISVGNDRQWEALVRLPGFGELAGPGLATNAGRIAAGARLHESLGAATRRLSTQEALAAFREAGIPAARVNTVPEVAADPAVRDRLVRSTDPVTGTAVAIPGPPVESEFLAASGRRLSFPPRLGEHNAKVYGEIGVEERELAELRERRIV
ncbi:MAG: CoA transferase [Planctomycetes bacterium]|nr:CoA transferase [Planctomycetota bacterium]